MSASRHILVTPERFYVDLDDDPYQAYYVGVRYCESCAARIAEAEDPTRSVSTYYADTRGESIRVLSGLEVTL